MKSINNIFLFFLFVSVCLYGALHLNELSFWIDEGFSSYVSREVLAGNWSLFDVPYWLHTLLQVGSFSIFGISDWAARLPSLLLYLFNGWLVWKILTITLPSKSWGPLAGVVIYFLLSEILAWGLQARFYTLLTTFVLGQVYLFIRYQQTKLVPYIMGLLFCIGAGFSNHLFLGVGFFFLIPLFFQHASKRIIWIPFFVLVVFFLFLKNPLIFLDRLSGIPQFIEHIRAYIAFSWQKIGILVFAPATALIMTAWRGPLLGGWQRIGVGTCALLLIVSYVVIASIEVFHTRYVAWLFPLFLTLGIWCIFQFGYTVRIAGAIGIVVTAQIVGGYPGFLDRFSPQPDFRSAYQSIPDDAQVVSGFPVLCEWYYGDRGACVGSLRVDMLQSVASTRRLLKDEAEFYTKLPFLDFQEVSRLSNGTYIVLDDLSRQGVTDSLMLQWMEKFGTWTYVSGAGSMSIGIWMVKDA